MWLLLKVWKRNKDFLKDTIVYQKRNNAQKQQLKSFIESKYRKSIQIMQIEGDASREYWLVDEKVNVSEQVRFVIGIFKSNFVKRTP